MASERASSNPDFVSAFSAVQEQLACPVCYGKFRVEQGHLECTQCARTYPIVEGIPVLTPASADSKS